VAEADAAGRREALVELYERASACTLCPLSESRSKVVFGAGNADAELMFVGEAPGAEEDRQGLPFVGRAGILLNELLAEVGLKREDAFVANVLKCKPPGNRDPQPLEIETCRPYLERQIELIEPKLICTLGNFSTKLLTGSPTGITRVRGSAQQHVLGGRKVTLLPLFHPAAGLRTAAVKETLREDFKLIPALIEQPPHERVDLEPEPEPGPDRERASAEPDQLGFFG